MTPGTAVTALKQGKKFVWKLEVEVIASAEWVADGFEATALRVLEALDEGLLRYAESDEKEIKVRLIARPHPDAVAKAQGYASHRDRKKREASPKPKAD